MAVKYHEYHAVLEQCNAMIKQTRYSLTMVMLHAMGPYFPCQNDKLKALCDGKKKKKKKLYSAAL